MDRASHDLVSSILAADVNRFQALMSSADDKAMLRAIDALWSNHKSELEQNEKSLRLFLELFTYQFNKFLIKRQEIVQANPAKRPTPENPLKASLIKDIFSLVRERQMLAY